MADLNLTSIAINKRQDGNYLHHESHLLKPHEVEYFPLFHIDPYLLNLFYLFLLYCI